MIKHVFQKCIIWQIGLHFLQVLHVHMSIYCVVCSRSLLCKNNLNNFVILHDMHMGLESLESALKSASFKTKITSIADWEHVEPENTIHCNGIV